MCLTNRCVFSKTSTCPSFFQNYGQAIYGCPCRSVSVVVDDPHLMTSSSIFSRLQAISVQSPMALSLHTTGSRRHLHYLRSNRGAYHRAVEVGDEFRGAGLGVSCRSLTHLPLTNHHAYQPSAPLSSFRPGDHAQRNEIQDRHRLETCPSPSPYLTVIA